MIRFPLFPRRKAATISNGVFLILLAFLFYTGQWWPGILFALGLTIALRQYLTGHRFNFFISVVFIGALGVISFAGYTFSVFLPLLLFAAGIFLIAKECIGFKGSSFWNPPSDSDNV